VTVEDLLKEKIGDGLVRKGAMKKSSVHQVLIVQACGDSRCFGEIAAALSLVDVEEIHKYMNFKYAARCSGFNKKRILS